MRVGVCLCIARGSVEDWRIHDCLETHLPSDISGGGCATCLPITFVAKTSISIAGSASYTLTTRYHSSKTNTLKAKLCETQLDNAALSSLCPQSQASASPSVSAAHADPLARPGRPMTLNFEVADWRWSTWMRAPRFFLEGERRTLGIFLSFFAFRFLSPARHRSSSVTAL